MPGQQQTSSQSEIELEQGTSGRKPGQTRWGHPKAAIICAIVFLILCAGLIAYFIWTAYAVAQTEGPQGFVAVYPGVFRILNTELLCQAFSCAANNAESPYGRAYWPHLNQTENTLRKATEGPPNPNELANILGAATMTLDDAIVVWGRIPTDVKYWALIGYCYDIPDWGPQSEDGRLQVWASCADSASSARISPRGPNDSIAVIFTANVAMIHRVAQSFKAWFGNAPIQIWTQIIPQRMYNIRYRYQIMSRVVLNNSSDPVPNYECMWFVQDSSEPKELSSGIPLIPRGSVPNERKQMSLAQWEQFAAQTISSRFKVVQQNFVPLPYLFTSIPGGLDYGYQCLEYRAMCRADNRDTFYFSTTSVPVTDTQALVVLWVNHYMMWRCKVYSSIELSDQSNEQGFQAFITGQPGMSDTFIPPETDFSQAIGLTYTTPPANLYVNGSLVVFLVERGYVSPINTVSAAYDSILPAYIAVVERDSTLPDCFIQSPFNSTMKPCPAQS